MNLININSRMGFSITNKTETDAEITIYEEIGDSWWGGVSAKSFSDELKGIASTVKNLSVRINSPGGNVFDGISIYNRLKQHKATVTVYVDGLAASIASIIALAGDEVVMGEGALMMIHKPMSCVCGNQIDMEAMVQRLDDVEDQLLNIYKKKTGIDRTELKNMLAAENGEGTWMSAQEALDFGFADKIMDSEDILDIAACAKNAKWKIRIPEQTAQVNTKLVKAKLNSLKTDVESFLAR